MVIITPPSGAATAKRWSAWYGNRLPMRVSYSLIASSRVQRGGQHDRSGSAVDPLQPAAGSAEGRRPASGWSEQAKWDSLRTINQNAINRRTQTKLSIPANTLKS